jgi:hypothetical protein
VKSDRSVICIKKNEMCWACSTYGDRRSGYRFWWANLRKGDHLADLGVDGRITLKWILEKWNGDINWINLAQDNDR